MKDKLTFVISFMATHNIQLPSKPIELWRQVPSGTYTHKSLPFGPMREGITDGILAHFVSGQRTVEVHLANLDVKLDNPFPLWLLSKRHSKNTNQPKQRQHKPQRPVFDIADLL